VAVTIVLVVAMLGAMVLLAQEGDEAEAEGGEVATETQAADTEPQEGGQTPGDPEAGAEVFTSAGCGGCHALEEAGSSGAVGPNLDESQPDRRLVVDRVTNGKGLMPAFGDDLSEEQIQNVAAYVVRATSESP
jgi:mono/diheme cytochrome c family protein